MHYSRGCAERGSHIARTGEGMRYRRLICAPGRVSNKGEADYQYR